MAFTIAQAGSALQVLSDVGAITTLTLPSGVTIDATIKGQFHILGRQLLFTGAGSVNLWIDPLTFEVRSMILQGPTAAPTLAAASTGLTGDYVAAYSFGVVNLDGQVINESALSPLSDTLTLANQAINWTGIQVSADSSVNCRVLYRSLAGGNGETLFQRTILLDNVTTSLLTDNMTDDALGVLPAAQDYDPPAGTVPGTRASLAIVYRSRLFIIDADDPDDLRWSDPDLFFAFGADNGVRLTGDGEDEYGGQGFLPRKSELIILKRKRLVRFVGDDEENFQLIPDESSQDIGCIAPKSAVVISDVGYFLGPDGVYAVDNAGVRCITRGLTDPWFKSDLYFNRDGFYAAEGSYNSGTHSYELMLPATGSGIVLNRWIAYDIAKGVWWGRHSTTAFTPSCRGALVTSGGQTKPSIGGTDGYIYYQNRVVRSDTPGLSGISVGIAIEWIHSFFHGDSPDLYHYWGMPTFYYQNEGSVGTVDVSWYVGELVGNTFPLSTTLPLSADRKRTKRLGQGRLMRFKFTHSTVGENFLLRGFQVYFNTVGRR